MQRKKDFMSKLVLLGVITTGVITSVSLSRYQTLTHTSSDAKVAIYAMEAYGSDENVNDIKIDCTDEKITKSLNYVITNKVGEKITEVSVSYKIKVVFSKELPNGLTLEVSDMDGNTGTLTKTENTYIFENDAWVFSPGTEQTNNITLTFTGENNEDATSSDISDVQVSVITEQIN